MQRACNVIRKSMGLPVVALLLAQVREVVEARPIPRPLALAPIVGLRFGFGRRVSARVVAVTLLGVAEQDVEFLCGCEVVLVGGFSRERVERVALLRLGGEVVGVGVGGVGVDVFHS